MVRNDVLPLNSTLTKAIMRTINNNQLFDRLKEKGQVKTHFFNGYGWTYNTKRFIVFLREKGLINKVDFFIENIPSPSKFKQRITLL